MNLSTTSQSPARRRLHAGAALLSIGAGLAVSAAVVTPAAAVSAGDLFSAPTVLGGVRGGITLRNNLATGEAGEPSHAVLSSGLPDKADRSLWYRWKSPINGRVSFRTRGSDIDTVMAAYTGTSLTSLTQIDSDDDTTFAAPGGGIERLQSQVSFKAVKGVTYSIAVDSFTGSLPAEQVETGRVRLSFDANDDFSAARPLATSVDQGLIEIGDNTGAGSEVGEPQHAPNRVKDGGRSIWYSYTAPKSGSLRFTILGTKTDLVLAAYKGAKVDALVKVAAGDDTLPDGTAQMTFPVEAGKSYKIAVDGKQAVVDEGDVVLSYGFVK